MIQSLRPSLPQSLPQSLIASRKLQLGTAVFSGALMSALIFSLMHQLIGSGQIHRIDADLFTSVNIYEAPPEAASEPELELDPVEQTQSTPTFEPSLQPLQINAPTPAPVLQVAGPPVSSFEPGLNDVSLASGLGNIFGSGEMSGDDDNTWTPPGDAELAKKITSTASYREVLPRATRQPNVPKYAWDNKIDGWVLVAFTVNASGYVENVRVLDAHPRGVFEENVIASVKHWVYSPADLGGRKVKVQLTQKIELFWKDYPNNNTQLQ